MGNIRTDPKLIPEMTHGLRKTVLDTREALLFDHTDDLAVPEQTSGLIVSGVDAENRGHTKNRIGPKSGKSEGPAH